ncbi:MAG: response regulator transcription factor [Bacteroidetes bacterium]|nr:response regulator transcription factor [Bacteroidota bacterium]
MAIKVSIVEDDKVIREGESTLIQAQDGLSMVGAYENAESFRADIRNTRPDVVLMDIELPGYSGIACIRQLKPSFPSIQFMMFTVFENPDRIFDALSAGATGYILKSEPPERLLTAIKEIYEGSSPMSAPIARLVVNYFNKCEKVSNAIATLTLREREVLEELSKGLLYKEIAEKMFISIETVRSFIRSIYEKLHVHSRTDAINMLRKSH